ncbi:hypothetical protein [Streptomyces sp. TRM68367]|uniref:hypothetical protein n=1 Tax=Streptomyces sp. TRM68367 TaxID=2758415 RepID=UPI00165BED7C|nr:hypothetical protein [Streptomyces sp. TRM68367]MBC9731157.1 hypothetical protein [Streptomyces sp. TRM68367]
MAPTETGVTHLGTETLPLHELTPYPGNARRGDVPTILESLCRNGQYRSLVVRDEGDGRLVVLAGNHTLQALAAHGPGPCGLTVKVGEEERPCAVCHGEPWEPSARCELITCDDDTARRIVLVDNRSHEEGTYDEQALVELLAGLDEDLTGTGYSDADLEGLLSVLEDTEEEGLEEAYEEPAPRSRPETQQAPAEAPAAAAPSTTSPQAPNVQQLPAEGAATPAPAAPAPPGHVQMLLTYTPEDRDEAARLVDAVRELLPDASTSDIVLRALRTLVAVLDSKHAPDAVVTVAALIKAAGADRP